MTDVPAAQVAPAQADAAAIQPSRFDLRDQNAKDMAGAKVVGNGNCGGGSLNEIVVCAPDQTKFRLRTDTRFAADHLGKAEWKLGDKVKITPEVEAAGLPQGVQSNRVMVRLKLGF